MVEVDALARLLSLVDLSETCGRGVERLMAGATFLDTSQLGGHQTKSSIIQGVNLSMITIYTTFCLACKSYLSIYASDNVILIF